MAPKNAIKGSTRLIGLIGSPVKNSVSPLVHNTSFDLLGLNYRYAAFDVDPYHLQDAMRGMKAMGFLGFNVTTPCKSVIIPYLDEISQVAEIMGAVNTVVILNGRFLGDNADGAAFMRNLVFSGISVRNKKITVLGAGGVASAIITQAALDGVSAIDVFNRNDEYFYKAEKLIERLKEHAPNCEVNLYQIDDEEQMRTSISESQLVVNATLVGTPECPGCLVAEDMLRSDLAVADVIYYPLETELIKLAKKNGCKAVNGVGMLMQQAAIGERLWISKDMPIDTIQEKLLAENA